MSCCWLKILQQKQLNSQFQGAFHHGKEATEAGLETTGHISFVVRNQRVMNTCASSLSFSLGPQHMSRPRGGCVFSTQLTLLHRHVQRPVPWVTVDTVKLTLKLTITRGIQWERGNRNEKKGGGGNCMCAEGDHYCFPYLLSTQ